MQARARAFVAAWSGESRERAEAQSWWNEFFGIFGVERRRLAIFERRARRASTGGDGSIDVFMPGVMIAEHKSLGKDGGAGTSQAVDYLEGGDIAAHEFPRYIVSADFETFTLTDLESDDPPLTFQLKDLPKHVQRFAFLAGYEAPKRLSSESEAVSIRAAREMGKLYDALLGDRSPEDNSDEAEDAAIFMTRLLFLLYGDDVVGLWEPGLFESYVKNRTSEDGSDVGAAIATLFQVLDTKDRRKVPEELSAFPYANGGLFRKRLDIPFFDRGMRDALIAATEIDWSGISPAIFGSLFQGMSSREERRRSGSHYTTETNILKVLRPLFLDELEDRLQRWWSSVPELEKLRKELGTYRFLDPACGAGNFLIVAYREMADLEFRIIKRIRELRGEVDYALDSTWGLMVQPEHFGGIELNWWPVKIAETAMFLTQHKVTQRLGEIGEPPQILPIGDAAHIVHGDALTTDWNTAVAATDRTFVFGNPPFHGHKERSKEEAANLRTAWGRDYNGNLDFVTAWHAKALEYLKGRPLARFAFVTTNSIVMGQSVAALFKPIYADGWRIAFAHRTFEWQSEAFGAAAVHCVIVGFDKGTTPPRLFTYVGGRGQPLELAVGRINAYLLDLDEVFVDGAAMPLSSSLAVVSSGSNPIDFGQLILNEAGYAEASADPVAAKYLRPFSNGEDFINGLQRWCLWLKDLDPSDVGRSEVLKRRLTTSAEKRSSSGRAATIKLAAIPHLFGEDRQPDERFLAFPQTFAESRRFMTVGYMDPSTIIGMKIYWTVDPTGLQFAIASTSMMITWQKTVGGRLKSDPSFSNTLVWNTFPLRQLTDGERGRLIDAGKKVLEARNDAPGRTLADLYNPLAMPKSLVDAHLALDRAMDATFGFRKAPTDLERQKRLFERYVEMTRAGELEIPIADGAAKRRRRGARPKVT
ncbi:DNA methyltransferase [Agromyces bracchium]|uniref:site-specific DNA-methyltransferase (adenine-specific) n=1 Tax=Agromyces bracchium TaxID=88376 RepID=A0A6I3M9K5_9MICO|nr:DNA methyltransferase [Agromyces bracchium]MTH69468.1 hypothetical protein [Agromyces bracchium]